MTLLKRLALPVSTWLLSAQIALAEATCTLNGEEVPCDEFKTLVGTYFGIGIAIALVVGAIGLAATVFWILMLVHALSNDIEDKAMWAILIVFTNIIGAVIYYFVVKRNFKK